MAVIILILVILALFFMYRYMAAKKYSEADQDKNQDSELGSAEGVCISGDAYDPDDEGDYQLKSIKGLSSYNIAEQVVCIDFEKDSMRRVLEYQEGFFDSSECPGMMWNELAELFSWVTIEEKYEGDKGIFFFKEKKYEFDFIGDDLDQERTVFALNQAVNSDFELRYVIDYVGNSESLFMVMTKEDWLILEEHYGCKSVARRFARFPGSFAAFKNIFFDPDTFRAQSIAEARNQ